MLAYRHAFHAGNHADVLKHVVLLRLLRHLAQKEKPFWVIDTHAGAGVYPLTRGHGARQAEYETGIGKLWSRTDCPPAVADYLEAVRALNPGGRLARYPGSPWLAWQHLRPQDRLRLFELHSSDQALLAERFAQAGRQVAISAADGFAGLKALLPPPPRRGLILLDPSYELREDYGKVVHTLTDAMTRFATGEYAIWYPQLARLEAQRLPRRLIQAAGGRPWLDARLTVRKPSPDGFGLFGSGLFIVNPPWTLAAIMEETLPWLAQVLGQDEGAGYALESGG